MTEYKKLVALTDLLSADVTNLCSSIAKATHVAEDGKKGANAAAPSNTVADPEQLYLVSSRIYQSIVDGCPRIRKMVLKARETDPNKQIYNETMCRKIEELLKSFCSILQQLVPSFSSENVEPQNASQESKAENTNPVEVVLGIDFDVEAIMERSPALEKAEEVHNQYILKRSQEEAWQSRVEHGLSDVVTFESQNRFVVAAEEKFDRAALVERKRSDKARIIRLLEERETAKWKAELQRRDAEQKLLQEKTEAIHNVANIPSVLLAALPDAAMRRKLVGHTRQLITALLRTPEDLNIRRLRNNNEHLIGDYGHPCLIAINSADGKQCLCAPAVNVAEVLWCRIGYSIRYTNVPNRSVESVRLEKRGEELVLPCGRPLSVHTYSPLGFEDYSERFFELVEPNVMEEPDDWMVWYNMMQEMERVLTELLSS
ncbi:hypothetical protein ABB37_04492 [Leptomonas pyrrhocoris]|uniref:PUB domain-containing protein n=1 Tax=Leptomonas pyrrhocoris TaxID=157538 RepID=A0A0M9G2L8_LEPPY|nr:hypothetical protein ABB37_04492 [Leptomonas pyrrhocoris]KPA81150.1 hypothetical protein ABB37_04492 [Leptomonas pyrrhocoris]|eukprot:XP_015659589.1 hypothetical protein ABB37_04492 [Leptomonas pyrrhocoris]